MSQTPAPIPRAASSMATPDRPNPATPFNEAFTQLVEGELSAELAERCFDAILSGGWTPVQISAFIAALRAIGEKPVFVAAAARSMRAAMHKLEHPFTHVLDTCGTGGDGCGTVNLSTGAAIICAALDVPVAKHGNRAVSSRSGSADVLQALDIPIDLSPTAAARVLTQANIAFLLAPTYHPAMRFAMPVRTELKVRTIFNCLGPLANPAGATHQLIGAWSSQVRRTMAETLRELGSTRAWVVHSRDGLDEISPYAPTHVTELDGGHLRELILRPEDFGLEVSPPGAAAGGDAQRNAEILLQVLRGEPHPARSAFVLNAAAALAVMQRCSPREAAARVVAALDDGRALAALERWRLVARASHSPSA